MIVSTFPFLAVSQISFFSTPVFNKRIFDTFKCCVDLLVNYEQSIDGNQRITRSLYKAIQIKTSYGLSGKYPMHLETLYAVRQLFHTIILNETAQSICYLTEVEISYIRQEIIKLLTSLDSGEEIPSVILDSHQISKVRKKIKLEEHPARKTTLLVEQIFDSKILIDPLKHTVLVSLIDIQTESQVRQFFIENLDRLINLIQSNTPLGEFLPLLNAYSISSSQIQAIRNHVNQPNISSSERTRLTILYLLQTVDRGGLAGLYKQTIIGALYFKKGEILSEYLKEELDTLIHSVEYDLPFSLDLLFLTPGLTRTIRHKLKGELSSDEKDHITITSLIEVVETNPNLLPVKKELLPLLYEKQRQALKLYNLNKLIDAILSHNPIDQNLLDLYGLTQEKIQEIRNHLQQEGMSLLTQKSILIDHLLEIIPPSEKELIKRLTFKKEIPFLIDLIRAYELSDDLSLQAKQLARKYGFNPENVFALKRILKSHEKTKAEYLLRLNILDLNRLIQLIIERSGITDEFNVLINRNGLTKEIINWLQQYLRYISRLKKLSSFELEEELERLEGDETISIDEVNSIRKDLLKTSKEIIISRLIDIDSFRRAVFDNQKGFTHCHTVRDGLTIYEFFKRIDIDYLRGKLVDSIRSGISSLRNNDRLVRNRRVTIEIIEETFARL